MKNVVKYSGLNGFKVLIPLLIFNFSFLIYARAEVLTLDSCLSLAKQHNAQIINYQLDIQKAEEVKAQAFTKYFPQVSAHSVGYYSINPLISMSAEDAISHFSDNSTRELLNVLYMNYGEAFADGTFDLFQRGVAVGVTALQPVYMGGQIVNGNKLASLSVEAAKLQAEMRERDILQTVEEKYWQVVGLQAKQNTLRAAEALLDTIEATVTIAVNAGLATQNDLLRVQLKRNELALNELRLNNGITLATQNLCQMIGLEAVDGLELIADSIDAQPNYQLSTINYQLRPESRLLDLQVEAATLKHKMELGKALPTVAIGANYSYSNLLEKNTHNATAFFVVSIPLTGWWETSHKLKEKQLDIQRAEVQRNDSRERLNIQVVQLYQQLTEIQQRINATEQSVLLCKDNLRLSIINHQAGRQTISELLEAQSLLLKAENDLTDAQLQYLIVYHHYQRLTGK